MTAEVVLRIDADTAKYIASLAKAAQQHKDVLQPVVKETKESYKEIADTLTGGIFNTMMKLATPAGAVLAIATETSTIFSAWLEKLERAGQIAKTLSTGLGQAAGSAGQLNVVGDLRKSVLANAGVMNMDTAVGAYREYIGANPGANVAQVGKAINASSVASIAQLNPGMYARAYGGLEQAGIANPADAAAFLIQQSGNQGEQAIELARTLGNKLGPGNSANVPQLVAGAARIGGGGKGGGLKVLQTLLGAYEQRGGQGDFLQFVQTAGRGTVDGADLATLQALQRNLPALMGQQIGGTLEASAAAAQADPHIMAAESTEAIKAARERKLYNKMGWSAELKELHGAIIDADVNDNLGMMQYAPTLVGGKSLLGIEMGITSWLTGEHRDGQVYPSQGTAELKKSIDAFHGTMVQQGDNNDRKRIRVDAHEDRAP